MPVDIVNVFRAPDALPGIAREAVAIHAGALWCQFGVINEEAARIAEDGGVDGDHGPLPQGRARALHREDALARLQHGADHLRPSRPSVTDGRPCGPLAEAARSIRLVRRRALEAADG